MPIVVADFFDHGWTRLWVMTLCLSILPSGSAPATSGPFESKPLDQFVHEHWDGSRGMPSNTVTQIVPTRDGFLWLATGNGLVRFDGNRMVTFNMNNTPALHSNSVSALLETQQGVLWIGCEGGGLVSYHNGRFRNFSTADGLVSNDVTALFEDQRGRLWIGTSDHDLNLMEDGRITRIAVGGNPLTRVQSLLLDHQDTLWIAYQQGLVRLKDGQTETVSGSADIHSQAISALLQDKRNRLWIGTFDAGIFVGENGRWRRLGVDDGLPGERIRALHQGPSGSVWVGTDSGLARSRGDGFEVRTQNDGLPDNRVLSLYEDPRGNLWFGSYSAGINRLKDGVARTWSGRRGLSDEWVFAIYQDHRDIIWVGTFRGGLNRLENNRFTHFTTADGLPSNRIWAITEDHDDQLWVGTEAGLAVRQGDHFNTVLVTPEPEPIQVLLPEDDGSLWAAPKSGGLIHLIDGEVTRYDRNDGMVGNQIRWMLKDQRGNLWAGGYDGVSRLDPEGRFQNFTTAQGLPVNHILSAHLDQAGDLWLGARGGGLTRYRDGVLTNFTTRDGLHDNAIWAILEDGRGNLWLSGDRGVYRVSKNALNARADGLDADLEQVVYGVTDGILNPECNAGGTPAAMRDRNGNLWFANMGGAVQVEPGRMPKYRPKLLIDQVIADHRPSQPGPPPTWFPAGTHDLEIHYTDLEFYDPTAVSFRYMLQGVDRDWVEAGSRRTAFYTNMPPGRHQFLVTAVSKEGVAATSPAAYSFTIQPFYYQRAVFKILLLALILTLLYLGHRFRLWRQDQRNRQFSALLEQQVEKRTLQLQQQKQEMETLNHITRTIHGEVEVRDVIESLLVQGMRLFPETEIAGFLLQNPEDRHYYFTATLGYQSRLLQDYSFSQNALFSGYLQHLDEIEEGIAMAEEPTDYRDAYPNLPVLRSQIAMTVPGTESLAGILIFGCMARQGVFHNSDVHKLKRFRDHAISAVTKALLLNELIDAQKELVETAHAAGMAEIATDVLHNMGNALNSVNTAAGLIEDHLIEVEDGLAVLDRIIKAVAEDRIQVTPQQLADNLARIVTILKKRQGGLRSEAAGLLSHMDQVTSILREQQDLTGDKGYWEVANLNQLVLDTVRGKASLLKFHKVAVVTELDELPPVRLESVKFRRVLFQLLKNAWEAIEEVQTEGVIQIKTKNMCDRIELLVIDNGIGLDPELGAKIFNQGFTTKQRNKGFGLHYCANAMREMSGLIQITPNQPERGVIVTLTFPSPNG